jgi:integrase
VDAIKFYLAYKDAYMRTTARKDTHSRIKKISQWILETRNEKILCNEFNSDHALQLMNWLLMDRKITGRNYNNYLMSFRTAFNFLVKQKYFNSNPFHAVDKLPETKKIRQAFTPDQQQQFVDYVRGNDYPFFIIAQWCYYCALRPNEIVQLKISNINFHNAVIHVPKDIAKNKRERAPVIADVFFNQIKEYYKDENPDHYLCSLKMKPGKLKISAVRISDHFRRVANKLKLPNELQFYSLKDTCADRLLSAGCDPRVIRDLFDHTDLHATDKYIRSRVNKHMEILRTDFPIL